MDPTQVVELIVQIVGVASVVATMTPNDSDNKVLSYVLKLLNLLGANFGKSKNAP